MSDAVSVRPATMEDAELLYGFIRRLAEYEREPDAARVTAERLCAQLASGTPPFEVCVAELEDAPAGFALFFPTYSTWTGHAGLWLEDFYVEESARQRGVGKALFAYLAWLCLTRGYARFELTALDWNELARGFYRKRCAVPMEEWTRWRIDGDGLRKLAAT